jgi:2-polyprenyl-3-methyl-5-hydroxy-6-metoxy-1,4-benzoquinol methylase
MYASEPLWQEFYRRLSEQARRLIDPTTGRVKEQYVRSVECPFCSSERFAVRVVRDGFQYVTCSECSFVYLNPQLTQQAIEEVYNEEEVRRFFFQELLLPHVERDQQVEFEERIQILKQLVTSTSPRLLDVGCAAGNFLHIAQRSGFQGEGLELNELYVDYVRRHRPLIIHRKLLEEMHYPEATFDIVTLWDVLEHLPQPVQTLRSVASVLKRGGVLGLTTINHACLNERLLKERWRYYMPPDHLCSFTPSLLERMLKQTGFRIVRLQHHYMFEVLADHWFAFLKSSKSPSYPFLNKAQKLIYSLLAHFTQRLFGIVGSGDLLTVYARKT